MMTQTTGPDDQPSAQADPLARRITSCAVWLAAYGLVWGLGLWRPAPQVAWVNLVIAGGIILGTLPPARIRPFCAAAAFLAVAAAMFFGIRSQLLAVLLLVLGLLALSDGVFNFRGQRS